MEDFNAELGAYLERLHPKTDAYLEQSLRGRHPDRRHACSAPAMRWWKSCGRGSRKRSAPSSPIFPTDESHPFLARRAGSFRYAGAWSSRLCDQGFHVNHLHPEGWISSCYYVTVPKETDDPETRNGWIKFGEPSLRRAVEERHPPRVQPFPGRLVLFPSYMWHGTIPLRAPSPRTTIAFDAVPQ